LIGNFTNGSAENTFFESFKTSFVDIIPSEFRSQIKYFDKESDALESSYKKNGTETVNEK
jgi:hypothetical protein